MFHAILTAGGVGSRMNLDTPKQFILVKGKPIIVHTALVFQNCNLIDTVTIVCLEEYIEHMQGLVSKFGLTKVRAVVAGGQNGQESIYNGLTSVATCAMLDDYVVIHDGNRPLVDNKIISNAISTATRYGNAIASIPVVEAVCYTDDGISSVRSIDRTKLRRTQTPHVFKLGELLDLHALAKKVGINNSVASCVLMNDLGKKVYFSEGNERNIKITFAEDLQNFNKFLS